MRNIVSRQVENLYDVCSKVVVYINTGSSKAAVLMLFVLCMTLI